MRLRGTVVAGALVLLLGAAGDVQPEQAEGPVCEHLDRIHRLTGRILERRVEAGRFAKRRYGTVAAYLRLRYGLVTPSGRAELLQYLETAGLVHGDELRRAEILSGAAELDPPLGDIDRLQEWLGPPSLSVYRALLLHDEGRIFFRIALALLDDPAAARTYGGSMRGEALPLLVWDRPDPEIRRIAEAAEGAGDPVAAGALYAELGDPDAHAAFIRRTRMTEKIARRVDLRHLRKTGVGVDTLRLPPSDTDDDRGMELAILLAGYHTGFLLPIAWNQSGDTAALAAVAREVLGEIEAGRLDPMWAPERAWLLLFRGMVREMGVERAHEILGSFAWPQRMVRHYAGDNALLSLERMLAREVLIGFAARRTAGAPARPELLRRDDGVDWDLWVRMAERLRLSPFAPEATEREAVPLAELALAVGRIEDAIVIADRSMAPRAALDFYSDLIRRLDRNCAGHAAHPGQGLFLGNSVLFKF